MFTLIRFALALAAFSYSGTALAADSTVLESFDGDAAQRWEFITDGVMGGVSTGGAVIGKIDGDAGVHLTGEVSTKNNGGFIQVRRMLPEGLPVGTAGLELQVRGNGQPYYVFIRTAEMTRPWYYYNAEFNAGSAWQTIRIPLEDFTRSHAHLSEQIAPDAVISVGLFAYGQDYSADLMVREIALF